MFCTSKLIKIEFLVMKLIEQLSVFLQSSEKQSFLQHSELLQHSEQSLPKGMETCYAGEISMYTERENRIQVATLEKTQLIAKDFSELRIHFWPDERALKKEMTGKEQRMTERAKKRRKKKYLSR
ncbi:predicted protein [Histoplasma mississippiense (nom. inval.)]|uniref:predicted protein n=1 Tax=Ajellomyces capsulatus (strain NAm1 / WU24) TaxID=2059318 RepID=UPI000157BC7A|nr:predicted protein [Histoplasma mississippiense (nom. inval.)]EDN06093.1 predicted protein [Histoplasma mississippiense (nom. inval.)]